MWQHHCYFILSIIRLCHLAELATVSHSDTRIGSLETDTVCLRFVKGERVRIAAGSLKGLEGTVLEHRAVGRILVQILPGVCVEVSQLTLETAKERP